MRSRKISIIGSGAVGCMMAADLSLAHHEVTLYEMPQFKQSLDAIRLNGGIELLGVSRTGFARIDKITTEISEAIHGAELIMVATVALAHETIAHLCAPHLEDGQTVVLFPGNYGSLVFAKVLKEHAISKSIKLADALSAPYGGRRLINKAEVTIGNVLSKLPIASLPSSQTNDVITDLEDCYPVVAGSNVLEMGLSNPNPHFHVAAALLNTGFIETSPDGAGFYGQVIKSPSVLKIIKAIFTEINAVCQALGVESYTYEEFMQVQSDPKVLLYQGPTNMQHRFISEDCPIGTVAVSSLGDLLGIPTHICDALIVLASEINGVNYFNTGRNLDAMGLSEMSSKELLTFITKGDNSTLLEQVM